jgi:hypothetical protein
VDLSEWIVMALTFAGSAAPVAAFMGVRSGNEEPACTA